MKLAVAAQQVQRRGGQHDEAERPPGAPAGALEALVRLGASAGTPPLRCGLPGLPVAMTPLVACPSRGPGSTRAGRHAVPWPRSTQASATSAATSAALSAGGRACGRLCRAATGGRVDRGAGKRARAAGGGRARARTVLAHDLPQLAAALTYYTVLSLLPALIVVVALLGIVGLSADTVHSLARHARRTRRAVGARTSSPDVLDSVLTSRELRRRARSSASWSRCGRRRPTSASFMARVGQDLRDRAAAAVLDRASLCESAWRCCCSS